MTAKKRINFDISERKILLRIFDIIFVLLSLHVIGTVFTFDYFTLSAENWHWALVLAIYITLIGTVFEIYDLQSSSRLDITFKNVVFTASVTVLFYLLTPFFTPFLPERRIEIVYFYITILTAIFLWRIIYVTFISSPRFYKKVLLIGDGSQVEKMARALTNVDPYYDIIGYVDSRMTNKNLTQNELEEFEKDDLIATVIKNNISEIVVGSFESKVSSPQLYVDLISLLEKGFVIREYTQVYESILHRIPIQFLGDDFYRYFPFSRSNQNKLYLFFSRTLDVLVSIIGLVICVILTPLILIINLFYNKGPLFYKQERVGKNGKLFDIIKFRTMVENAEEDGAQWASKNDRRVTSFGRLLRNTRLDELPQFYNVLKGDMALIGPRPERKVFVDELSAVIPFYETRHIIKPGLTGWAQVKMRYGSSVEESIIKLQYDLFYIKRRSFFLDVNVIVKTISTVLYYRGQ